MEQFFNDNLVTVIGSLLIFGAVIGLGWNQARKIRKSGLTLTEYINDVLLAQHMGFVLIVLFLLNISEAVYAASIPETEKYLNPVARFFAHFGIQFVSILMMITLPQSIVELIDDAKFLFSKQKKDIEDLNRWFILTAQMFIVILVAVTSAGIPVLNFFVIAAGLDELQVSLWAFQEILGFRLEEEYIYNGLSKDYNPFLGDPKTGENSLSYPMWAGIVLLVVHIALSLLDGTVALKRKLKIPYEKGTGTNEDANTRLNNRAPSQQEIDSIKRDPNDALEYLIQKAGNSRDIRNIDRKVEDYFEIYEGLDRSDKANVANQLATLTAKWRQLEKDEEGKKFPDRILKKRSEELKRQTLEFFRKSPKVGGFGRALSNRNL